VEPQEYSMGPRGMWTPVENHWVKQIDDHFKSNSAEMKHSQRNSFWRIRTKAEAASSNARQYDKSSKRYRHY